MFVGVIRPRAVETCTLQCGCIYYNGTKQTRTDKESLQDGGKFKSHTKYIQDSGTKLKSVDAIVSTSL